MDVSIIIVNYKTAPSVIATVDSIYRYTKGISFEVLVVDNASGEDDCQRLREDGRFRLIELPTNMGFGKANNMAAQQALGHYLLFLNPDTLLLNNAVDILASYLTEHPSVGIVGGNLFNGEGQPIHSFHRLMPGIFSELDFACHQIFRKLLFGKNAQFNHTNHPLNVAMITGADLMIRREIFEPLGGFDEAFFMYNEDADLCLRTSQMGYQITSLPSAHIQHLEGQSFSDKSRRALLTIQGRNTYFRKHYSPRYCEWANRLYRISNTIAGLLYSIVGNNDTRHLYKMRVKYCKQCAPILINGRFLLRKPTGVEQYAIHMTQALFDLGVSVELICPRRGTISPFYHIPPIRIIRRGITSGHIWEQCFLPLYRLFHHEGNFVTFCGLGSVLCRREVMTIHDLSFLENPQWFSKTYASVYRLLTPLAAHTAKAVLTVSHYSASQINKAYPYTTSKTYVIPCALPNVFKQKQPKLSATEDYFLTVASLDPRKNVTILIQLMQQHPELNLKIVGCSSNVFASTLSQPIPNNVELLGYVDNQSLAELYMHAKAFIFPSLYEGFGIPPLEAMASGCPVLCSDIPVLREVLGDVPYYFRPTDIHDLLKTIKRLNELTAEERKCLIERGFQLVNTYSWHKSAQTLMDLISTF